MSEAGRLLPFPSEQLWISEGRALGEREQSARSLMWDIGDWWNRGDAYGARAQIVTAGDWTGPKHAVCRYAGSVAARWKVLCRHNTLSFEHHRAVAPLPDEMAIPLLHWCLEAPDPRSVSDLRNRVKQIKRDAREKAMAEKTEAASAALGSKLYGVIYADPPWRFEPYSRETGMDRAADNHYPTMTLDDIKALTVPAAEDCVLFLWATVPMLPEALAVMAAWGFGYKSHFVWVKDRPGTGYWTRNQHELLLIGARGEVPAPAPGTQYCSVIEGKLGPHSAKPAAFAEIIDDLFPAVPSLEMFARAPRLGWDVWGNQA
jgi:N6-adenosine-specific RNA methylase IME4